MNFSMLRMRNLFDPNQPRQQTQLPGLDTIDPGMSAPSFDTGSASFIQPQAPQPPPQPQGNGLDEIAQLIAANYKPKETQEKFFEDLLQHPPLESQFKKPSFFRKFTASAVGMANPENPNAAQEYAKPEYTEAYKNWKTQLTPAQQAVDNERASNINERVFATDTAKSVIAERRRIDAEQIANRKTDIAQQRADAYTYKSYNPQSKIYAIKGGNLVAVDPATNKVTDLGVSTGTLSDIDKATLNAEDALSLEEVKQKNRITLEGVKGSQARATKEATPGSATANKPPSNTQISAGQDERARTAWSMHPEWRQYILRDQNTGKFLGTTIPAGKESGWLSASVPGGDPKIKQQVDDFIFGKGGTAPAAGEKNIGGWIIR